MLPSLRNGRNIQGHDTHETLQKKEKRPPPPSGRHSGKLEHVVVMSANRLQGIFITSSQLCVDTCCRGRTLGPPGGLELESLVL